jgi:septal ring factor EnvC (AmiA/AmiB activator)
MTISTESFTAVAGQARQATEKSVETFRNVSQSLTNQLDALKLPTVDLTQPVTRYFEYLQKAVDVNRDLAIRWAEMVTTLSGSVREQAQQVGGIVQDQAATVADLTTRQAEKAEQAAKAQAEKAEQAKREQAEEAEEAEKAKAREAKRVEREEARKAQQQAEEAEEAEKAKAREAKRVEREEARKAQQKAREAYEGLTKAELSDQLAGRGLPKTGNIDDLIERLVSADSE